jgi:hypothetical protein
MKLNGFFGIIMFTTILISCNGNSKGKVVDPKNNIKNIELELKRFGDVKILRVDKEGFYGKYVGHEWLCKVAPAKCKEPNHIKHDIAHQFSNKVSHAIGDFLKKSYNSGKYLKIDFNNTSITTRGKDQKAKVEFIIKMPFITTSKCDAFTAITQRGTWVNEDNLTLDPRYKKVLKNVKNISADYEQGYFTTPEGYKEYWVQYKNKDYQSKCD